jgi:hypothetical protein
MPKQINTTAARQGVTPHVTRYVLSIGLTLAIVGMAIAWYFLRG